MQKVFKNIIRINENTQRPPGPEVGYKYRALWSSQPQVMSGLRTSPLRGRLKSGYLKGAHPGMRRRN